MITNIRQTSFQSLYPHSSPEPGRMYSSDCYRWGFQNQEMDNEIKGTGNSVNFKYRVHDPRLGRFLSIDPLAPKYPGNSPYAFSENRVIDSRELEGLERTPAGKDPRYDHLFRGNWTQWKNGYNVWYESSSQSAFKIYHGTSSMITLVHRDMSQGFSISHPSSIIPKMESIATTEISVPFNTQAPSPLPSPNLAMTNTTPTGTTHGESGAAGFGDAQTLAINFTDNTANYSNALKAKSEIYKITNMLIENPNITATITVGTNLKSDDNVKDKPNDYYGSDLVKDRFKQIYESVLNSDPSLYGRVNLKEDYGNQNKTTVTYDK